MAKNIWIILQNIWAPRFVPFCMSAQRRNCGPDYRRPCLLLVMQFLHLTLQVINYSSLVVSAARRWGGDTFVCLIWCHISAMGSAGSCASHPASLTTSTSLAIAASHIIEDNIRVLWILQTINICAAHYQIIFNNAMHFDINKWGNINFKN